MADRVTRDVVCDNHPDRADGVVRVTVSRPSSIVIADLCPECQEVLDSVLASASDTPRGGAPRVAPRAHSVKPID